MSSLKKLRNAALKIGATVEDEKIGDSHSCRVEAPLGYVWVSDNLHEFVDSSWKPWKPDYADLLSRVSYGIKPCPLGENCEWCNS